MGAYGGVDVQFHVFLTSILVGGEWIASWPGKEPPAGWNPGPVWTIWRSKILDPTKNRTPIPRLSNS
jgi:hypothetical protein